LLDEIFLRGFVLQLLKERLSLWPAIMAQAVLAVLLAHVLEIFPLVDSPSLEESAWILVYGVMAAVLNEKVFAGYSVIPSAILIGIVNRPLAKLC